MGQKTNPNIFRLGKTKEWNAKYSEKKTTESSTVIFKDLEVRKFIFRLFSKHKLYIKNCKTYHSENVMHIYVSYYNSEQSLLTSDKLKKKFKIQPRKKKSSVFRNKNEDIKKISTRKKVYLAKTYHKNLVENSEAPQLRNLYFLGEKSQRLESIKALKTYVENKKHPTLKHQTLNLFTTKMLKTISLFTEEKQNIFLHLKQLNTEGNLLKEIDKRNKKKMINSNITLRKFQKNNFFVEGLNLIYNFYLHDQNPKLLADFIAIYLKKLKRPNFFLRFIKVALKTLGMRSSSQIKRIQIKIKGRFNGAPRSKHKFINVGKNVPIFTLRAKVNYSESTAFTSNGTFGVKVWTYSKT